MIYIKNPGTKMWGYRCDVCGREILSTEELKDLTCTCCGMQMVNTNIPKAPKTTDRESEESPGGGVAPAKVKKKEPLPDACRNCCYSRKGGFELPDGTVKPGVKCLKDGRTHSPDAICQHHSRRGRIAK